MSNSYAHSVTFYEDDIVPFEDLFILLVTSIFSFPFRQVRVKRNSCAVAPMVTNLTQSCALHSSIVNEDDADYCAAWEEETELTSRLPSCNYPEFKYSTAANIQGYPIMAHQGQLIHVLKKICNFNYNFSRLQLKVAAQRMRYKNTRETSSLGGQMCL